MQVKVSPPLRRGFTLIEMLVIAPIAVIIIAGFIGLMIRMTGDVISSQQRSTQIYNTQTALNELEQDINHAGLFTTSIPAASLTSPQGSGNNGTAWNASPGGNTLLLQEYATTANPNAPVNELAYTTTPNDCGSFPDYTYNKPYLIYVVYYLGKPAGSSTNSLWRRTILPPGISTCTTPYQKNSCAPGATMNGSPCKIADEEVLDNVTSLTFDYFTDAGDTGSTSDMEGASTIDTTITTQDSIAGHSYTYTADLRATRLNNTR